MHNASHIISLSDEQGIETRFEMLGICRYADGEYLILLPPTEENPAVPVVMLIEGEGESESYIVELDPYKKADILNNFCLQQQEDVYPCGAEVVYPPEMKFLRPTRGWMKVLLFLLRCCMPILTLLLIRPYIDTLYIHQLSGIVSPQTLQALIYAGHMAAIGWGMNARVWLGWQYELAVGLLPLACCMLLFFAQYHFSTAVCIMAILLAGMLWLFLTRHKHESWLAQHPSLFKWISADAAYSKSAGRLFDSLPEVMLRRYVAVGFVALMLVPSAFTSLKYGLDPIAYRAKCAWPLEEFENDEKFFHNFIKDNWMMLSLEEKIDALQGIAYLEADRLNIDHVFVHAKERDDGTIGFHIYNTRDIFIDLTHEDHQDPMECIRTILHECRHVYQNDCINSMNWANPQVQSGIYFEDVREWRYNMENYRSVSKGDEYEWYYRQPVEQDAREYAENAIAIYESIMMQYEQSFLQDASVRYQESP